MQHNAFIALLKELHLAGDLNRNTPEANRQAIRELIAGNSYWTFDADREGITEWDYDELVKIVAKQLGLSPEQFNSEQGPYIDPELAANGLYELRNQLEAAAKARQRVLFATSHPGSLLGLYTVLVQRVNDLGGVVCRLDEPKEAPEQRWLDDVMGVIMLSDEGNLMHTHTDNGMRELIREQKPDLVVGDHGFVMAAINEKYPAVAFFDVDDPALPLMAYRYPERVLAIPLNDNQTNTRSAKLAEALWNVSLD